MVDEESLLHAYRRYISSAAALAAAGNDADAKLRHEAAVAKMVYHGLFEEFLRAPPPADERIDDRFAGAD